MVIQKQLAPESEIFLTSFFQPVTYFTDRRQLSGALAWKAGQSQPISSMESFRGGVSSVMTGLGGGALFKTLRGGGTADCKATAGNSSAEAGTAQLRPIRIAASCPFFTLLNTAMRETPIITAASGKERNSFFSGIIQSSHNIPVNTS